MQCRYLSNIIIIIVIILSHFSLILGPKSILFSCGVWFVVLFCFIHDLSRNREEKLIYFVMLII